MGYVIFCPPSGASGVFLGLRKDSSVVKEFHDASALRAGVKPFVFATKDDARWYLRQGSTCERCKVISEEDLEIEIMAAMVTRCHT